MNALVREVTTVGGITNLIGAAALARYFPGATALDKLLAVVLVLSTRDKEEPPQLFESLVKQAVNRLLTPLPEQRNALAVALASFVVYNGICILFVGSG
jgi:hypothetical protein